MTMGLRVAMVLGGIGRTLIGSGLIILLFVAYQLWGTGIQESRAQDAGKDEFATILEDFSDIVGSNTEGGLDFDSLTELADEADIAQAAPAVATGESSAAPSALASEELDSEELASDEPDGATNAEDTTEDAAPSTAQPNLFSLLFPEKGKPVALIEIPKIGVEKVVYEGVQTEDLKKGPGHYPTNPLPGQPGNAAIAGHRTTYGAPFGDIDKLAPGDDIFVQTVLGRAHYQVREVPFVVEPTQVEVLDDYGDNRITLTACHPKYSARQRLIATAVLVSEPFPLVDKPAVNTPVAVSASAAPTTTTTVLTTTTTIAEAAGAPATPGPTTASPTTTPAASVEFPEQAEQDESTVTTVDLANTVSADSDALDAGLGWDTTALQPAILWGLGFLAAGALGWLVGRREWLNRWVAYALVLPVAGYLLWNSFFYVDRFLPAY